MALTVAPFGASGKCYLMGFDSFLIHPLFFMLGIKIRIDHHPTLPHKGYMSYRPLSLLRFGAPKTTMRTLLLLGAAGCALVIQAVAMPAVAGQPRKKADDGGARDLLLMCQGRYEDPELGLAMCTAYLKGYLDRAHYNHREGGAVEFCSETGRINPQAAADAVTHFAFTDPNSIDEPMPVFLSLALQKAYPCSEELAAKILEEENKPPPEPVAFVPKGPAGPVGASKVVVMSDDVPPPPTPRPERAAGPVVKEGQSVAAVTTASAYNGPKAGPTDGAGRAMPPRALDSAAAPAAAPGTRKAAMTVGGATRDATPEIVIRPEQGTQATDKPVALSAGPVSATNTAPKNPVKIRNVGMPPSMTESSGAARPQITPPVTMGGDTLAATDAAHAKALPPNTKPYGAVNPDGTPAPKRP